MTRIVEGDGTSQDIDDLVDIAQMIMGNTICPLGDAAAMPVTSFLTKFRSEFEKAVKPSGKSLMSEPVGAE